MLSSEIFIRRSLYLTRLAILGLRQNLYNARSHLSWGMFGFGLSSNRYSYFMTLRGLNFQGQLLRISGAAEIPLVPVACFDGFRQVRGTLRNGSGRFVERPFPYCMCPSTVQI
jgi:hypothetical protein